MKSSCNEHEIGSLLLSFAKMVPPKNSHECFIFVDTGNVSRKIPVNEKDSWN